MLHNVNLPYPLCHKSVKHIDNQCINIIEKFNVLLDVWLFSRLYALRRVKDAFRDGRSLTDKKVIKKEFDLGAESLEMIRRQVKI